MTDEATIRQIVREEIENLEASAQENSNYSRRDVLAGIGLLGTGAGLSLAGYGAVGQGQAASDNGGAIHGVDQLGLSDDPIGTIYVDSLYQNEDVIDTDSINPLSGSSISIGGATDYQDNDIQNVGALSAGDASIGVDNGVVHLNNNDPDKPNVEDYLNNDLSQGDIVVIDPGEHTISETISPLSYRYRVIWRGTLVPSGDFTVWNTSNTGNTLQINVQTEMSGRDQNGRPAINTKPVDTYTSTAFEIRRRIVTDGILGVFGTGTRIVDMIHSNGNENFGGSRLALYLDGRDSSGSSSAEVGLMVDNEYDSGGGNLNGMDVWCGVRKTTSYGTYINAGIGSDYRLFGTQNDGAHVGLYAGDGPRGSTSTGHAVTTARIYSDSNNGAGDEISSGVSRAEICGEPRLNNVTPADVHPGTSIRVGGQYKIGPEYDSGSLLQLPWRSSDPTADELRDRQAALYVSDGSTGVTGDEDDVILAVYGAGTVKTTVLFDFSAN